LALAIALHPTAAPSALADTATDWNAIMQATVSTAPSNAVFQTRWGAITQLAVFEAVNAIEGDYEPYLGGLHPGTLGIRVVLSPTAALRRQAVWLPVGGNERALRPIDDDVANGTTPAQSRRCCLDSTQR
jgi:hypothetical protein